ncbi:uncharacterized protein LOC101763411 isoform X1 [Setaria italica]|uniref:uncharacterized protein LOC101763411 isoform X1 n=1 Tax=Setaria italica TaxID=4555 RepID=UPI000BE599BE|nr:uncharacterized protein LOC101763411 isoform X1 [Setaria italica]
MKLEVLSWINIFNQVLLQANILVKAPFPFVRRPLKDVPICQLFGLSFLCFFSPFPSPCAYSSQATALKSTAMAVSSWTITTPTQVYKGWAADGEPAMVLWPASCGAVMGTKAHCVLQEQAVLHLRLWHQLLDSDRNIISYMISVIVFQVQEYCISRKSVGIISSCRPRPHTSWTV